MIVSNVATEELPGMRTVEAEQVGALAAAGGFVTAQVRTTSPVNPLLGATMRLDVPLLPGSLIATWVALIAKPGAPGPFPFVTEITAEDGS